MAKPLELVGRGVAISSSGHSSRSADHRGVIVEVISRDADYVYLIVSWLDGRTSVIPASECAIESASAS